MRKRRNSALRQAVQRVIETLPEPFDFHQVWAALPEHERPGAPQAVSQMLHQFQQERQIFNTGQVQRFGRGVAPAKYRRATAADQVRKCKPYVPGKMSDLERRYREFRNQIAMPAEKLEPEAEELEPEA